MATAAKKKPTVKEEEKVQEEDELEVFEAVAKSVTRTLTNPETGEERTFSQHELAFIPKTKFFRLVSSTLRVAADEGDGVNSLIGDVISGGAQAIDNDQMVLGIMRLVELSPNFLEEAFIYALNVKPIEREWVFNALDSIDDDTGIDIIEVFIAQNGPAIQSFLTKKLPKLGKKVGKMISIEDTEQE